MNAFAWIGVAGTIPLLVMPFVAVPEAATYRYSFLFLVPLLWVPYFARRALHLHPVHYGLYAAALALHDLGALGCYRREYFGLSFDTYVHFYFGVPAGLVLARLFRRRLGMRPWTAGLSATVFVLGLGAIHELVECGSSLVLGKEKGMLKANVGDEFDTQKDLFNNLLGCLTALGLSALVGRRNEHGSSDAVGPSSPA